MVWGFTVVLWAALPAQVPAQEAAQDTGAAAIEAVEPETALPRVSILVTVETEAGRKTPLGTFVIELFATNAPKHVDNFLKLVREEFYVGTTFHRIVPAFIIQGGDLLSKRNWQSSRVGTGADGPDYTIEAEIDRKHLRGAVVAARKPDAVNPNRLSGPSQFYICLADLPSLDLRYTVFGQVVLGMDVVDKIARVKNTGPDQNRALQRVTMTEVKLLP